jgi:hypothetical protein
MLIIHLLFLGLVLLVARIGLVWIRPERGCRWCGGTGKSRLFSGRCWRCDGDGHVWRLGAGLVRRVHIAGRNAWLERKYRR